MPTITYMKVRETGKYSVEVEMRWRDVSGYDMSRKITAEDAVHAMESVNGYMKLHNLSFDFVGAGEYIGEDGTIHEMDLARGVYGALDAYAETVWEELNNE